MHDPDWSVYGGTTMETLATFGTSKGGLIELKCWLTTTLELALRFNAIRTAE